MALALLHAGLSILPVRLDGSKAPEGSLLPREKWNPDTAKFEPTWEPFKQRLPTEEEVKRWFDRATPPGIGVIGGAVSGGLECVDFDADAERVFPAWRDLVEAEAPGLIAKLCIVRTPRHPAGFHVRYRCIETSVSGNMKLAVDPSRKGKDRTLIETRGEGGYAVAPGSPADCHETRGPYEHVGGPPLITLQTITAAEREILIRCAMSFDLDVMEAKSAPHQSANGDGGLRPGDDFDRRGPSWNVILEPHGWRETHAGYWRRPGKDGPGWSATTGVCHGKDGEPLLRMFSSNADPFEEGRAYGRFRAFALLNHGGDLSAAARELAQRGFGDQRGPSPKPGASSTAKDAGSGPTREEPSYRFSPLTSGEFFAADWRPTWLVKRVLVKGQPAIIGAPQKSLKTSISVDLSLSLGTGTPFLGTFDVEQSLRVAVISGESGQFTLQETGLRVGKAKRIDPRQANVLWGFDLPQLANPDHIAELCDGLESNEVEVLILDPLYLCLLAGGAAKNLDAANLFHTGPLFRAFSKAVLGVGCTPILVHHAVKHLTNPSEPMELQQLAYSGVAEFARQWILLNRREPYAPDRPGSHRLWLGVGGSCGQSGRWSLDVEESSLSEDFSGRKWEVAISSAADARRVELDQARTKRQRAGEERNKSDDAAVLLAVDALSQRHPTAPTKNAIRIEANMSGDRITRSLDRLTAERILESTDVTVKSGNGAMAARAGFRRPLRDRQERPDHPD